MPDPRRNVSELAQLAKYLETPHTMAEIRKEFKLSERCGFRWMAYLRESLLDVVSRRDPDGSVKYQIIGGVDA